MRNRSFPQARTELSFPFAALAVALLVATAVLAARWLLHPSSFSWDAGLLVVAAFSTMAFGITAVLISNRDTRQTLHRYAFAFEKHPAPMWIFDVETFAFLDVNEAALEQYGYSRSEFLALTALDIRPPEDVPKFMAIVGEGQSARHSEKFLRHQKKNGTIFDVQITATPVMLGGRRAELVLVEDLTSKNDYGAQQELQQATELLNAVFHTIPLAIWGVDLAGCVMFWSRTAETMFGWKEEEIKGSRLPTIPLEQADEYELFLNLYRQGERLNGVEKGRVRRDNSRVDCAIWSAPLRSAEGEITGTVEILADITQRKSAEEELNRHVRRLAASNAELRQFAYAASHDLQEPIRVMITCTQMFERLANPTAPAAAFAYLRYAREGAFLTRDLVKALGEYWEIDQHQLLIKRIPLDRALGAALRLISPVVNDSEAEIVATELPIVHADFDLMVTLFVHLLTNAIKFRSSARPRVVISSVSTAQSWTVLVKDNGIGIQPEFAERVFKIFNRLSRERAGVGMGLSISKKIVELHDGRIWIAPDAQGGTIVQFEIPARAGASEGKNLRSLRAAT